MHKLQGFSNFAFVSNIWTARSAAYHPLTSDDNSPEHVERQAGTARRAAQLLEAEPSARPLPTVMVTRPVVGQVAGSNIVRAALNRSLSPLQEEPEPSRSPPSADLGTGLRLRKSPTTRLDADVTMGIPSPLMLRRRSTSEGKEPPALMMGLDASSSASASSASALITGSDGTSTSVLAFLTGSDASSASASALLQSESSPSASPPSRESSGDSQESHPLVRPSVRSAESSASWSLVPIAPSRMFALSSIATVAERAAGTFLLDASSRPANFQQVGPVNPLLHEALFQARDGTQHSQHHWTNVSRELMATRWRTAIYEAGQAFSQHSRSRSTTNVVEKDVWEIAQRLSVHPLGLQALPQHADDHPVADANALGLFLMAGAALRRAGVELVGTPSELIKRAHQVHAHNAAHMLVPLTTRDRTFSSQRLPALALLGSVKLISGEQPSREEINALTYIRQGFLDESPGSPLAHCEARLRKVDTWMSRAITPGMPLKGLIPLYNKTPFTTIASNDSDARALMLAHRARAFNAGLRSLVEAHSDTQMPGIAAPFSVKECIDAIDLWLASQQVGRTPHNLRTAAKAFADVASAPMSFDTLNKWQAELNKTLGGDWQRFEASLEQAISLEPEEIGKRRQQALIDCAGELRAILANLNRYQSNTNLMLHSANDSVGAPLAACIQALDRRLQRHDVVGNEEVASLATMKDWRRQVSALGDADFTHFDAAVMQADRLDMSEVDLTRARVVDTLVEMASSMTSGSRVKLGGGGSVGVGTRGISVSVNGLAAATGVRARIDARYERGRQAIIEFGMVSHGAEIFVGAQSGYGWQLGGGLAVGWEVADAVRLGINLDGLGKRLEDAQISGVVLRLPRITAADDELQQRFGALVRSVMDTQTTATEPHAMLDSLLKQFPDLSISSIGRGNEGRKLRGATVEASGSFDIPGGRVGAQGGVHYENVYWNHRDIVEATGSVRLERNLTGSTVRVSTGARANLGPTVDLVSSGDDFITLGNVEAAVSADFHNSGELVKIRVTHRGGRIDASSTLRDIETQDLHTFIQKVRSSEDTWTPLIASRHNWVDTVRDRDELAAWLQNLQQRAAPTQLYTMRYRLTDAAAQQLDLLEAERAIKGDAADPNDAAGLRKSSSRAIDALLEDLTNWQPKSLISYDRDSSQSGWQMSYLAELASVNRREAQHSVNPIR